MKELMTEQVIEKELEIVMPEEESEVTEKVKRNGFWQDNRGVGVVEIILILVVLIALVLIFKEQLGSMVTKAMETLEKSINEVLS